LAEHPRLDELRRRVQKDPAAIAFAQLGEEYRRAGEYEEAVRVCRAGLEKHPTYLSARVTLGRALIELQQYEDAQAELEYVLRTAPENLAAIRGLAEIHQRRGDPLHVDERPGEAVPVEPALEVSSAVADVPDLPPPVEATQTDLAGEWELETFAPPSTPISDAGNAVGEELSGTADVDPVVLDPDEQTAIAELESWLQAIVDDRRARGSRPGSRDAMQDSSPGSHASNRSIHR
jgi:tetratricopeptide (TPR) repeat protein